MTDYFHRPGLHQDISSDDRLWAIFCHLAGALGGYVCCCGSLIFPWIIWLVKHHESSWIDLHGRDVLNFQINFYIVIFVILVPVFLISIFMDCGLFLVASICLLLVPVTPLVLGILGAVKASNNELFHYPYLIRFL